MGNNRLFLIQYHGYEKCILKFSTTTVKVKIKIRQFNYFGYSLFASIYFFFFTSTIQGF